MENSTPHHMKTLSEVLVKEKEKLIIQLEDWDHTCGDGCCYTWGTTIRVNGVELERDGTHVHGALAAVLEHLGYEVEIN